MGMESSDLGVPNFANEELWLIAIRDGQTFLDDLYRKYICVAQRKRCKYGKNEEVLLLPEQFKILACISWQDDSYFHAKFIELCHIA